MASSSPPPPPDPNRHGNNPFDKSHYLESSETTNPESSSSKGQFRPSSQLRRAKTLSNPENETTWRREPLLDITNSYLTRTSASRRLTRVDLPPRANDDLSLIPSPTTPSRLTRNSGGRRGVPLRRTRSEIPGLVSLDSLDFSSLPLPLPLFQPETTLSSLPLWPDSVVNTNSATPTRELRSRTRSANQAPSSSPSSLPTLSPATSPDPIIRGTRRTRSSGLGTLSDDSSSPSTPATPPSISTRGRRRTFGGLSTLPEDATEETSSASRSPSVTMLDDAGTGTVPRGGRVESSENDHHRRLRRRRSVGGGSSDVSTDTLAVTAEGQSKKKLSGPKRSGLR